MQPSHDDARQDQECTQREGDHHHCVHLHTRQKSLTGMRLLACLIVAPQRGYDEPAILSYAISSFCPTSADGLQLGSVRLMFELPSCAYLAILRAPSLPNCDS
jgi:hypothetical protein